MIDCHGAPRDLGREQGEVARDAVRRALPSGTLGLLPAGALDGVRGLLRLRMRPDAAASRVHRDLGRFFPHLAERTLGLARGAGVPLTALTRRLAATREAPHAARERVAAQLSGADGAVLLGCGIAADGDAPPLRRSAPESDFRSLERVWPWAAGALGGVNEHGLAAVAVALPAPVRADEPCSAPATLLVQECLQRFDALEAAVAWCERRPAGGRASLLLADASGRAALVVVEGRARHVRRAEQGVLVGPAPADGAERLAKRLREVEPADARALAAALLAEGADHALLVDPAGGRVGLASGRADALRWDALA